MKKMLDLHIRNPGVPSPAQKRYILDKYRMFYVLA